MATIGGSLYATAVHEFFDGLRSYDAERACAVLADDADLQSPWNQGVLQGKEAIQEFLASLLSDPVGRPSFTITNIRGDGHLVHLDVSMSRRFGSRPIPLRLSCLHLKGIIHHIVIEGRDGVKVPAFLGGGMGLAEGDEPASPPAAAEPAPKETPAPAEPEPTQEPGPATYTDYEGDVDDVIDVEGIGPVYAKKLADAGIHTTARLCYEGAARVQEITGARAKTVDSWLGMAQLMKVSGIAGQYAEALYRGGVTGIPDLQTKSAGEIEAAVNAYMDSVKTTVQKNKITARRISGWKKSAANMQPVELPAPAE